MSLAEEMKNLRKRTLLTQKDYVHTLSVTPSTVNRWETSKAKPYVSTMKKIRDFCLNNNISYSSVEEEWINYTQEENND